MVSFHQHSEILVSCRFGSIQTSKACRSNPNKVNSIFSRAPAKVDAAVQKAAQVAHEVGEGQLPPHSTTSITADFSHPTCILEVFLV